MNSLLFLTLFTLAQPAKPAVTIIEVPTKGDTVHICATLRAPTPMSARETAAWNLLADSLIDGNQLYSRDTILLYGSQSGVSPSVRWDDHLITIRFSTPRSSTNTMLQILGAMLKQPLLNRENIAKYTQDLKMPRRDDLSAILQGNLGDFDRMTVDTISKVYLRAFRPENLCVAISVQGGETYSAGLVQAEFNDWHPATTHADAYITKMGQFNRPERANVLILAGRPMLPTTNAAAEILAGFALGVGKGSSCFRIVREQLALTYRQDTVFYPTDQGWREYLVFGGGKPLSSDVIKDSLLKDIDKYDAKTLVRAKAMATSALIRGSVLSPFMIGPGNGYYGSESDRVAWHSYWGLLGLDSVTPENLNEELQAVTLEDLKSSATEYLNSSLELD